MNRRKNILKFLLTGIIIIVSLLALLLQLTDKNFNLNNQTENLKNYYEQIASNNKSTLRLVLKSINNIPTGNKIINSLLSSYFNDNLHNFILQKITKQKFNKSFLEKKCIEKNL
ncbi:MAG: hypothetical protein V1773_14660 [bacterium]